MTDETPKPRFQWNDQIELHAQLLAGIGTPYVEIARRLGCNRCTVRKHLGLQRYQKRLSLPQLRDLFEQYDAKQNVIETLNAPSGSTEQARLRASLRARDSMKLTAETRKYPSREDFTDEELCADLARLVGRPLTLDK